MGKPNRFENSGSLESSDFKEETPVVQPKKSVYNKVIIQSVFPAHLKYVGAVSGKVYEWLRAGDIVEVESEDVAGLLAKRIGAKGCCGDAPDGNKVFAVLE